MSTTRAKTALAALIHDSRMRRATDYGVACDVDAAGLLMSPEVAAELAVLRTATGSCEVLREMHAAAERENAQLRARVAELEAAASERVVANVRTRAAPEACGACGALPKEWCPDCAMCEHGCFDGRKDNLCTHPNATWGGAS